MATSTLTKLATRVRYDILHMTTEAGSGHPTSSLSATDLLTGLFFGGTFRFDLNHPQNPCNDRIIFSKGHASPLFYALYAAAGVLSQEELLTYRRMGSPLEGHPTPRFAYAEAATGSLGQGLGIGVGIAMNGRYVDKLLYNTYVLMGDSEVAEGSVWEAAELASHYQLDNLVGILDVNRLGQRGETMLDWELETYEARFAAFGWHTIVLEDGHNIDAVQAAYGEIDHACGRPTVLIARTIKGKGVSFLENQDGWHGKTLNREQFDRAVLELGPVDLNLHGTIEPPVEAVPAVWAPVPVDQPVSAKTLSPREAYGRALVDIAPTHPGMVVLDAEVSNSTFAITFRDAYPERFFEMYIAEQNMISAALGFSTRGKIPFVSTFAAFFSRAFDQIRMAQYALDRANIKFVGSHVGVSIGPDGPSQMGLEDIALFRTLVGSVVLYPADDTTTAALVRQMADHHGICYMRTTRQELPRLYKTGEEFPIGGSKTLRHSDDDRVTLVGGGITLHEALKAADTLAAADIHARVIDLYSVKPLDLVTLHKAAAETAAIITIEDHYAEGGIGEAVAAALSDVATPVFSLAVRKLPMSGKPEELLAYEDIDAAAIVRRVQEL
ncbi:transketolase [Candidatus Cryosericum hinesii]|jgi:transketolase|uniref:Transketolase n=1 Tax=Candidatus Cryosericum hinesii TaxID=2290915 RepID=A0A398DRN9_9BACT|nr:transketolase [Candidatus Cryosericum hinesii]RIE14777.1 transketolase [Candidatus Cryosericum hinesii]